MSELKVFRPWLEHRRTLLFTTRYQFYSLHVRSLRILNLVSKFLSEQKACVPDIRGHTEKIAPGDFPGPPFASFVIVCPLTMHKIGILAIFHQFQGFWPLLSHFPFWSTRLLETPGPIGALINVKRTVIIILKKTVKMFALDKTDKRCSLLRRKINLWSKNRQTPFFNVCSLVVHYHFSIICAGFKISSMFCLLCVLVLLFLMLFCMSSNTFLLFVYYYFF